MSRPEENRQVLMIVENNPVPLDRRVWQEARALHDVGYDVTVISPRSSQAPRYRESIDDIRVLRHPRVVEASRPWQYAIEYVNALFWEFLLSTYLILFRGVDIVHIANPPDTAFILAPLFRLARARVVFDQHDLSPEIFQAKYGSRGLLWRALRAFERASYRAADIVIASNESMKSLAVRRGDRDPETVFVVRNGPDLERFHLNGRGRSGNRYGHTVCYMGVIGEQEGLDAYIRVIDDIVHVRGRTDAEFLIIGDGTGLAEVKQLATAHGLNDHVRFTGYLSGDTLVETLGTADVCVVPEPVTPLTENSTLIKTMEYMAMAKPVVQYDIDEARVTSGDTALYAAPNDEVDLADKILQLLDNPHERDELGGRAAARVRAKLAWHHQVPNLLRAYEAAFTRSGRGRL